MMFINYNFSFAKFNVVPIHITINTTFMYTIIYYYIHYVNKCSSLTLGIPAPEGCSSHSVWCVGLHICLLTFFDKNDSNKFYVVCSRLQA